MNKHKKRLLIEYADGKVFEIRTPSIQAYEEIRADFELLSVELNKEEYKNITIMDAYKDPTYKHYVDKIFSQVGVEASRLTAETIYTSLFPHENEDGSYERYGTLVKFIFGEPDGKSHVTKEEVDVYARTMGQLMAIYEDYNNVLKMMNDLSYEDLAKVMEERAEQLKPREEKAKEAAKKKAVKALDNLKANKSKLKVGEEVDVDSLL